MIELTCNTRPTPADRHAAVGHVGVREDPARVAEIHPHHVVAAQAEQPAEAGEVERGIGEHQDGDQAERDELQPGGAGQHQRPRPLPGPVAGAGVGVPFGGLAGAMTVVPGAAAIDR